MPPRTPVVSIVNVRSRRGVILYFAMGLLVVLGIMAGMLYFISDREVVQSIYVYQSEVITNLAEAASEEIFFNIVEQLNTRTAGNRIYDQVRTSNAKTIEIDKDYLKKISANARKTAIEDFGIAEEHFVVTGKITDISPFDIPGFKNPPDPIEKHGSLKLEISITYKPDSNNPELTKTVVLSRPFKVVRTTVPVLSECTLFVNNLSADYFGAQESVFGYQYRDFPNAQKALVLDNGWAGTGQKTFKKSEFTSYMENEVVRNGKVPPGRIFINKGIVPLANGDRSSGALQKTFHSAESEFLPQQVQIPLKALKEVLAKREREALQIAAEEAASADAMAGTTGEAAPPTSTATSGALPEKGDIIFRYVGHGRELFDKDEQIKESLGGRSVSGYSNYFSALADKEWKEGRKPSPSLSGLALFGNVVEKERGKAVEGEGFFGKLWAGIKKITSDLMEKLYSNYRIRISPTLVYGEVVQSYFMIRDFMQTGWLDKMKNTLTFNPNQFQLPYFPINFLDGKDAETPISKADDLPAAWSKDVKEKWLKLPEEIRKPKFYITLNATILAQQTYGLGPEFLGQIPAAAIFQPYNLGLLEFLIPEKDSPIRQFLDLFASKGFFFLKNELDKQFAPQSSPFKEFDKSLTEFNPFLFYTKATDYISSLYDPRNPKVNQFYKKYYNEKEKMFDINGVVYITGTEDLLFANNKYRGKGIIITFGRVVFKGFMVKHENYDKPDDPAKNALLTIVALGGIEVQTSERIDAQLYSYIYPLTVTTGNKLNLFGSLGCNFLDVTKIPEGGRIVFDYTYHIDPKMPELERDNFYYVSVTNEINKYEYAIRRDYQILTPGE